MESNLTTAVQLKALTSLSENIDVDLLNPHLLIAQQLYVAPILGDALYLDILTKFDNDTLSGDTLTLYQDYIVPALGFSAWYSAAPFLTYKTTRAGIQTQTASDGSAVPVTPEELSLYITRIENFKNFYCERLRKYLEENKNLFPLYRANDDCSDNGGRTGGSGIYLGYRRKIQS